MRPVLYLDIDDTLLTWASGRPRAARDTRAFLLWALPRFEIRWLTRWCPSGEMSDELIADLARMTGLDPALLRPIGACRWAESESKVDGISWLEHIVLRRAFFWVENPEGLTPRDHQVLDETGFRAAYLACNVTRDETALARVRGVLERGTAPAAADLTRARTATRASAPDRA